jgi:transcriptional repressor NrdR
MKCPECGFLDDKVLETRIQKDGQIIRRRRECLQCKSRFSTQENLMSSLPYVVKKDGRRETFNKEKILSGIQKACQKRPVSSAQIEQIAQRVSKTCLDTYEKEVPTVYIGQLLMQELKNLDDVAYVRFASVYRTFKDVNEFVQTLEINTDDSENFTTEQINHEHH